MTDVNQMLDDCTAILVLVQEVQEKVIELDTAVKNQQKGYQALEREILKLTRTLDEHPDDYDGPCECRSCLSYFDG